MATAEQVFQKIRNDTAHNEAVFNQLYVTPPPAGAAPGTASAYKNPDVLGGGALADEAAAKLAYITLLSEPPAAGETLTANQRLLAEAALPKYNVRANFQQTNRQIRNGGGCLAAMALTAVLGAPIINSIVNVLGVREDNIAQRVAREEIANNRYRRIHGTDAPWYNDGRQVVRKVENEEKAGSNVTSVLGGLFGLGASAAAAAWVYRNRKDK